MPAVPRDLRGNPIRPGGLYRCCIESLKQHSPEHGPTMLQEFTCPHCNDRSILVHGVWEWDPQA